MDQSEIRGIILATLIFLTTILAMYLFSTLGLKINNFLTLNLFSSLGPFFSTTGFIFLLVCGLPLGLILLVGERFEYKKALLLSETGYLLGIILGIILFNLHEFILPLFFVGLGILWGLKQLKLKESELKSRFKFSAGQSAAEKLIILFIVGFTITLVLNGYSNSEQIGNQLVPELLSVSIGDINSFESAVTDLVVGVSVNSQRELINSITSLESYETLSTKEDLDVRKFVIQTNEFKNEINKPEYVTFLKEEVEKNSEGTSITQGIMETLPLSKFSEQVWIIYVIIAVLMVHMFGSLVIKNISTIYYIIFKELFKKIFDNGEKEGILTENTEQNEKN